jgi:hypothetical protein
VLVLCCAALFLLHSLSRHCCKATRAEPIQQLLQLLPPAVRRTLRAAAKLLFCRHA